MQWSRLHVSNAEGVDSALGEQGRAKLGQTKIPHASLLKDFCFKDLQTKKMPPAVTYMRKKLFTFQKMEQKEKAKEDVKLRKF